MKESYFYNNFIPAASRGPGCSANMGIQQWYSYIFLPCGLFLKFVNTLVSLMTFNICVSFLFRD